MTTATITSKGQITLPKKVRECLGVGRGDRIAFTVREDGVVELQPETGDLLSLAGVLESEVQGVTIEEMNEAIAAAAEESGRL